MISDNMSASPPVISNNQPPDYSPALATTDEGNYSDFDSQAAEVVQVTGFIPTLEAWSKPLHFTPAPPPPPPPGTLQLQATLNGQKQKKGDIRYPEKIVSQLPVENIPPPALKGDDTFRFSWVARMNQASRNLFRAADPTCRLDGTSQMTISSKVLRLGP
ncbi:hypothetical protein Bca4012_002225 [Brassica carinata]